jgi:hypothetical protein
MPACELKLSFDLPREQGDLEAAVVGGSAMRSNLAIERWLISETSPGSIRDTTARSVLVEVLSVLREYNAGNIPTDGSDDD